MRMDAERGRRGAVAQSGEAHPHREHHANVVFLTLNDVYELLPNDDGQGGVAEFATLLKRTRDAIADEEPLTKIIVTLNGDFLWRSELDRQDKGPLMMEILHSLGIEYVVMGNHEFDFGAVYLQQLLSNASFTSFGSNIRQTIDGTLMKGLQDLQLIALNDGFKLGLFGVCTTETAEDPFAGNSVRFEDEILHAKRCVESLKAQGADVIVALTHMKMKMDRLLARHVPGISLILGGHDHEVTTEFVNDTMIHKSGQNALWLGSIRLHITKKEGVYLTTTHVRHEWQMLYNRGNSPRRDVHALVEGYRARVEAEDEAQGKLEPLAVAQTALDGTRARSRRGECSVGYLITDAMREQLEADVALIYAGLIKGDKCNAPGLVITPQWLERVLPQPRETVLVVMPARTLRLALQHMLRKFPSLSSSHPHISGLRIVYAVSSARAEGTITSLRLTAEPDTELVDADRELRVALPVAPAMDGWSEYFETAPRLRAGAVVRDVVRAFLTRHEAPAVAYAADERRVLVRTMSSADASPQ